MAYTSQITFTLDTICPWTYLALRRLQKALAHHARNPPPNAAAFTLTFSPYQLYPEASKEGEDKYEWYKREKYDASAEKMSMYTTVMGALGEKEGIRFKFGGIVANTLDAHRLIQWVQANQGPVPALKVVESLYKQYFEQERHPSSPDTLLQAATAAGIPESDAKAFIDSSEGLQDVKVSIREQVGNGVDAVPYVVFEGRRRDFTLLGAKEVEEYVKTMLQVAKES